MYKHVGYSFMFIYIHIPFLLILPPREPHGVGIRPNFVGGINE